MKIHPEKCQYRRRTTHMYVGRFAQDDDILDKIPINILSPGNYSHTIITRAARAVPTRS